MSCQFDVVAIAASLGGFTALQWILSPLPADFPAAILVVQHLGGRRRSVFAQLISNYTRLRVKEARGGTLVRPGVVQIAPPGQHLLVNPDGRILLSDAPRVQFARPSATVLFESVANLYRERAIAVVLTGMGSDGSEGVQAIKRQGGRVLVQDRETAESFSMPRAAIKTGSIDFVLPIDKIAPALVTLVMHPGAADLFRVPTPLPPYLLPILS